MTEWAIAFIASTALAATGFVVVAIFWLKRLRDALATALGETAGQQIRSTQRISETIASLQRRQNITEQQLHALAESNARLQKEMAELVVKSDLLDKDSFSSTPSRIIH